MNNLIVHRISRAIEAMAIRIQALDADGRARMELAASLDQGDWLAFGEFPSRGLLAGVLDAPEAQALHAIHTDWDTSTVAERTVFLLVMQELVMAGIQ